MGKKLFCEQKWSGKRITVTVVAHSGQTGQRKTENITLYCIFQIKHKHMKKVLKEKSGGKIKTGKEKLKRQLSI